jgi:hypothetical protein
MRDTRTLGIALLSGFLAAACAAKIPPAGTFDPAAWSRVENLTAGVRVEVRYVTGNPPLRHHFEGTLLRAAPEILEIQTDDGVQRLLPQRVLQVAVGGRENRVLPLGIMGGVLGAMAGGMMSAINEKNDAATTMTMISGAAVGALLGFSAGARKGDARPVVIYSRSGSL